jgi:hypothetical protein
MMKSPFNALLFLLFTLFMVSCGGGGQKSDLAGADTLLAERPHVKPIPPIAPLDLLESPHMDGKRVATIVDIDSTRAVFSMKPQGVLHRGLPLRMPYMVYSLTDVHRDTLMVIIQCEQIGEDTLIGVRTSWNKYFMTPFRRVKCATHLRPIGPEAFGGI